MWKRMMNVWRIAMWISEGKQRLLNRQTHDPNDPKPWSNDRWLDSEELYILTDIARKVWSPYLRIPGRNSSPHRSISVTSRGICRRVSINGSSNSKPDKVNWKPPDGMSQDLFKIFEKITDLKNGRRSYDGKELGWFFPDLDLERRVFWQQLMTSTIKLVDHVRWFYMVTNTIKCQLIYSRKRTL